MEKLAETIHKELREVAELLTDVAKNKITYRGFYNIVREIKKEYRRIRTVCMMLETKAGKTGVKLSDEYGVSLTILRTAILVNSHTNEAERDLNIVKLINYGNSIASVSKMYKIPTSFIVDIYDKRDMTNPSNSLSFSERKEITAIRNKKIYSEWISGTDLASLSAKYKLSRTTISNILTKLKEEQDAPAVKHATIPSKPKVKPSKEKVIETCWVTRKT